MLGFYKELLLEGLPRRVSVNTNEVVHVFLDGAVEESDGSYFAGCGGVLTSHDGRVLKAFGYSISKMRSKRLVGRYIRLNCSRWSWRVSSLVKTLEGEQ